MATEKTSEDQLKAVCFAAGISSFIACIERAVFVSLFAHWRVWVFLILNLLLLAILFMTSKSKNSSNDTELGDTIENAEGKVVADLDFNKKKIVEESKPLISTDKTTCESVISVEQKYEKEMKIEGDDGKSEEVQDQIAKEELNRKVEAFIAKFRQHLVSDAKGNRYRMHQVNTPHRASFSHSYEYIRS